MTTNSQLKILFDFDGTVCSVETIPYVAAALDLPSAAEIASLTECSGSLTDDYDSNLRLRIKLMENVSVEDFARLLPLHLLRPAIAGFIRSHREVCAIASCNLDCWISHLTRHLGIPCHLSKAIVNDGCAADIEYITDKAAVVRDYRRKGYRVVFIGDSASDLQAMGEADAGILLAFSAKTPGNIDGRINVVSSEKELLTLLETFIAGQGAETYH